jgi:photosystem II stability/assembly factor-like uncharacterized protein
MKCKLLRSGFFYSIIVILFSCPSLAQQKPSYDTSKGFFDYQKKMNAYYDQPGKKKPGYKQWKRMEWYFSTRVGRDGKMLNLQQLKQDALQEGALLNARTDQNTLETNIVSGAWTPVGPVAISSADNGIGRVNRLAFHPSDANTIWAATAGGGLWKTTNGGSNWIPLTDGLPNLNLSGVAVNPSNTNIIYILTGDGDGGGSEGGGDGGCCSFGKYSTGVLKSTDGGITWNYTGLKWNETDKRLGYKLIMHPSDFNILFVGASNGIYRTTNGGNTWAYYPLIYGDPVYDIEFRPNNAQVIYAGMHGGRFFRTVDGGSIWTPEFTAPGIYVTRVSISVTPNSAAEVYFLVANNSDYVQFTFNGIYYSNNMGDADSWVQRAHEMPNVFSGDGTEAASGQENYDHAMAVSPFDHNKLITGGIRFFRSTNGGSSVTFIDNGPANYHVDIHELAYGPSGNTLYAATDGGVYRSTNDGVTWTSMNVNLAITQYYRISTSTASPNYVLGGSQDNGTHLRNPVSLIFERKIGADGMDNAISISTPSIMYGSSQGGSFHRSSNSGLSFDPLIDESILLSNYNINVNGPWVTPIAVSTTHPNLIFLGYTSVVRGLNTGTGWIFTNIGNTVTPRVSGRTFVKVAPGNTDIIYAGDNFFKTSSDPDVFEKFLYKTWNGGTSWTRIFPGGTDDLLFTDLAMNPDDPDEIWVTAGGFEAGNKVYRSLDSGAHWTNISGSLPNVPVNCIIYDDNNGSPNDALYIGTDIGVFYRDNTLGDWIPFSTGLPVVEITDLEINEADGLLRAATYGRGIWQTAVFDGACAVNLSFSTNSHPPSEPGYFTASNTIISNAVISGAGANIKYKAGQRITLTTGFRANASNDSKFLAYIGPCPGGGVPPGYYRFSFNGLSGYLKE